MSFEDKKNIMFKGKDGKDYHTHEELEEANRNYNLIRNEKLDTQVGTVASRMSEAGLRMVFEQVKDELGTPLYEKIKAAMVVKGIWKE